MPGGDHDGREKRSHPVTPSRTDIEQLMVALWQEQLKVGQVNAADNFLDLGGNSLAAMRIAARVQQAFGCEVPTSLILTDATFADLIDALCARLASNVATAAG
jgi:acyl carrier protein